jgi:hypothetical protein
LGVAIALVLREKLLLSILSRQGCLRIAETIAIHSVGGGSRQCDDCGHGGENFGSGRFQEFHGGASNSEFGRSLISDGPHIGNNVDIFARRSLPLIVIA